MAIKARRGGKKSNAAAARKIERLESIPPDVVLAPQAEVPRQLTSLERGRKSSVREMSWMEFDRLVQGLARDIRKGFKPDAVVGVAHGGVFVGGALASALGAEFFPVRISRRSRDKGSGSKAAKAGPKLAGDMPRELKGRRVLVVDDVVSSGDTLELARAMLAKVGAEEVSTACLVCKEEGYQPDYLSLTGDELIVFPWDYDMVDDERFAPRKSTKT